MIAVIFEVIPHESATGTYLSIASELHPLLQSIDGFISVERFESLSTPGKMVSLSFWRDESAIQAWRTQAEHRAAQRKGRYDLFIDYRLRIATVVRDYGPRSRDQAPPDRSSDGV